VHVQLPLPGAAVHLAGNPESASVPIEQFTTESYPVPLRSRAWCEALLMHRLRSELAPTSTGLVGTVTSRRTVGGIGMARIASSRQLIHLAPEKKDAIWLAVHLDGEALLHDGAKVIEIRRPSFLSFDARINEFLFIIYLYNLCITLNLIVFQFLQFSF
jgi:hypothetical protein